MVDTINITERLEQDVAVAREWRRRNDPISGPSSVATRERIISLNDVVVSALDVAVIARQYLSGRVPREVSGSESDRILARAVAFIGEEAYVFGGVQNIGIGRAIISNRENREGGV